MVEELTLVESVVQIVISKPVALVTFTIELKLSVDHLGEKIFGWVVLVQELAQEHAHELVQVYVLELGLITVS